MLTDCLVWIVLSGETVKVRKVEKAIKTVEKTKNVSTLGDVMSHLNIFPYSRDYGSFWIIGRTLQCGEVDDYEEIEIGINYLRSPETCSPVTAFEQLANHFDLKYVYRVEDREGELFINSDDSNVIYNDRYVILGNCFGLESHALCEFFSNEATVLDWFRTTAKLTVSGLEDCIRLANAITNTETGSQLSVIPYQSSWN